MSNPVKISGSRAAAILGLSTYSTPVNVWLEIMGREFCEKNNYEYPVFEGNAATRFGNAFENAIVNFVEKKYNKKVTDTEKYFESDFITCHIDGCIDGNILLENKTTFSSNYFNEWGTDGTDKIPLIYQVQVQHNLFLTKFEKCILPVLIFPKRQQEMIDDGIIPEETNTDKWVDVLSDMGYLKFYEIFPHAEIQESLILEYSNFWQNHVLTGLPPQPKNIDDIKKLFREPVGTIIATDEIERYYSEEKQINDELKELNARKEQLKLLQLNFLQENSKIKNFVVDDESQEKIVLRDIAGKKMHSYYKDKNGNLVFR